VATIAESTAGSRDVHFTLEADTVLLSLFVGSITAGSLTVTLWAYTATGEETPVISFPVITAPTAELLLRKAATTMTNHRLELVWSGPAEFSVHAKGLATGETSAKILGASTFTTTPAAATTTPAALVPATLVDRIGLVVKNNGPHVVYIGGSAAEATTTSGYPLEVGEALGIALAAGVAVWGTTATGTSDIRIAEGGG
jgi:hypothetical protein